MWIIQPLKDAFKDQKMAITSFFKFGRFVPCLAALTIAFRASLGFRAKFSFPADVLIEMLRARLSSMLYPAKNQPNNRRNAAGKPSRAQRSTLPAWRSWLFAVRTLAAITVIKAKSTRSVQPTVK